MKVLQMIRVAPAALSLLLLCSASHAEQQRTVLMIDSSVQQVSGARGRLGFERLPSESEQTMWVDPDGQWDSMGIALSVGGIVGAGLGEAHAQADRNASIKELRSALAASDALGSIFETGLGQWTGTRGYQAHRTVLAHGLAAGHVARGLAEPADATAVAVQRVSPFSIVTLSWDDRQPLLAMDVRVYARRDSQRGVTVREQVRSVVRYVGYQAPKGGDPRDWWAADGAAAFAAEVKAGLALMLPVVWDVQLEIPKVPRKETVTVQVGGAPQVFPGRLWKLQDGAAYLFNKDRGITIVATGGPPAG